MARIDIAKLPVDSRSTYPDVDLVRTHGEPGDRCRHKDGKPYPK